jgi:hypothetical protein
MVGCKVGKDEIRNPIVFLKKDCYNVPQCDNEGDKGRQNGLENIFKGNLSETALCKADGHVFLRGGDDGILRVVAELHCAWNGPVFRHEFRNFALARNDVRQLAGAV